jgi:hypothetical protein
VQNRQNLDRGLISQKSRDLFARFPNNLNNEFFPTVNPVHRVHARWTGAGRAVHRGPTVVRTEGTAARSPKLGLRPLRCTEAHRQGCNRERETWELGSGGAEEAGRWWCRTGRRRHSVRGLAQAGRDGNRSGERCGEARGGCSPFIGAGGAPGRGGRGG